MSEHPIAGWLADAPEFNDMVRAAAAHHSMLPDLVLKDYWVTRVLRSIVSDSAHTGRALFKGGTSLSKGWQLIDRFSEDIDLLLTGTDYGPPPDDTKERKRQFQAVRSTIEKATPLRLPDLRRLKVDEREFLYVRGSYHCNMRYALPGRSAEEAGPSTDWLLVESGFRGGVQPHARRSLSSMLADFIATQPTAKGLLQQYSLDLTPFDMDLLKPERTFVEKLLALHGSMSRGQMQEIRTRHYYDVAQLVARSSDVQNCLAAGQFDGLLRDAVDVSNKYFGANLNAETIDLRNSPALNPTPEQIATLSRGFEAESALYYKGQVSFGDVMEQVRALREML